MADFPLKVMLIEDNPGDIRLIREMLSKIPNVELICYNLLSTGIKRLGNGGVDLILLDLFLPDSSGMETFDAAYSESAGTPIVVLTGIDDDMLFDEAKKHGAHSCLMKAGIDTRILEETISKVSC